MSKTKTPDGEKCKRQLPFKLNDEDKARRGEDAAKFNKQIDQAVEVKKSEVSKHNDKIKDLTGKRDKLLRAINEGVERKEVTCVEVKNFDANKIEWWYEGEVLESRDMTPADRQLSLKGGEKAKPAPVPKWQKFGSKMKGRGKLTAEEEQSEEIAQVHKLETSKKGANSMVDPK